MFVLRIEHEQAFSQASLHRFSKKVMRMLRRDHPQPAAELEKALFLNQIDRWIELARASGIRIEIDLYKVCEASLWLHHVGIDITTSKSFQQELHKNRVPPADRAEQLMSRSLAYAKQRMESS